MGIAIKQEKVTDYTTVEVLSTDTVQPNAQNVGPVQIVSGPKGDKGDKGDKGEKGEQGEQGPKGDKGDKGDTGAQGPQGIQGVPGEKGADGLQGPKGDKGDKGEQGLQGPKGETGDSGVYIGTTPPEGTKVWINPEGEPSGDYIPSPETAEIGQTVVVKSVDENGKPLEWEAADFPEGGGDVSWDDIKDKPFGEGGFEWKLITSGVKTGSVTDVTSLSVTMGTAFVPALGVTYKVTIADMFGRTKEFTGVGNGPTNGFYRIGTPSDDIYASASPMLQGRLTIAFKEPYSASDGVVVNVYERSGAVDPIPVDWLPETVVMEDKLLEKGYQTEEQVNALINTALGVIENGTY